VLNKIDNEYGQLGTGTTTTDGFPELFELRGVLANKTIVKVATGEQHTVVLTSSNELFAWGCK
jgi:alpha-tubulin suppressor-like RCC1 family protein